MLHLLLVTIAIFIKVAFLNRSCHRKFECHVVAVVVVIIFIVDIDVVVIINISVISVVKNLCFSSRMVFNGVSSDHNGGTGKAEATCGDGIYRLLIGAVPLGTIFAFSPLDSAAIFL